MRDNLKWRCWQQGKIVHAPMTCGIFEVECCVAGVFFREYPKVDTFLEVPPSGSLADDLGVLISRLLATPDLQAVSSVVLQVCIPGPCPAYWRPRLIPPAWCRPQADLMRGLLVSAHTRPLDSLDSNSVTVSVVEMDGRHLVRQPTEFKNFADMLAKTFRHRPVSRIRKPLPPYGSALLAPVCILHAGNPLSPCTCMRDCGPCVARQAAISKAVRTAVCLSVFIQLSRPVCGRLRSICGRFAATLEWMAFWPPCFGFAS